MSNSKKHLILAVDTPNIDVAYQHAKNFKDHVAAIKLGLEFFISQGPSNIKKISDINVPIFLDLKLHDIPNTIESAVREAVKLGVSMLTIHTSGGKEMMTRAVNIARETAEKYNLPKTNILGVTILTAIDDQDLTKIGFQGTVKENVLKLASLANESGLDGIVCSAHEISMIKQEFGDKLKLIVPGIRFEASQNDDQKRVMTPKQALELGADYLVMGRPILEADDPLQKIQQI
jgi:orotidine-5'-phosphate decarboxylase